ncbi:tyrosine-type recombinase/integrase [Algoriphagus sp. SE2]|uniref:tyrosine-type recombinase/integrase n=1 Tax=Algoriphagus sp. SE2 TaxID=3141536 RepID=UPI0031CCE9FB
MFRTKIILKSVSKLTNLGNLAIEVTFKSKSKRTRVYIPTKEKVISHHFLGSKISRSHPDYKAIWVRVEGIHAEVKQVLNDLEKEFGFCTAELFREKFFQQEEPKDEDLISYLNGFIELKRLTLKPKLVSKLEAIRNHLNDFLSGKKIYPIEFNQMFVNELSKFWRDEKGLQPNTIAKNFKFIRQFLNHLYHEEILTSSKYQRLQYPKEVETFAIVLTKEEVKCLINYQPETSSLERVKDLFLVLIFTGLRFSDAVRIAPSWVNRDFLMVNTQKTGERVSIPLHSHLNELLLKYEFDLKPLHISNQKFNDYVKVLCKNAGIKDKVEVVKYLKGTKVYETISKHRLISSHTGRRTFITNAILAGIPLSVIQKITGHRKLSTLQNYVKIVDDSKKNEFEKFSNYFSQ